MKVYVYDRIQAIEYAEKYALTRNPNYFNFDLLGGNCTNFVSQCLYAGSKVMNYNKYGWYYNSLSDRAPAWTGVNFLLDFLTKNKGVGPFGKIVPYQIVEVGDIIFLERDGSPFHSLIITEKHDGKLFVSSNTSNAYNVDLNVFSYNSLKFVHILGVKKAL